MSDLQERLARLAEEAPPSGPPADLWRRGVRRRRRRAAGALAATLVSAVVLGSGGAVLVTTLDQTDAAPAATQKRPAIPERLRSPSPWTASVADAGPLGPLAALLPGEQHDHLLGVGSTYDPVGVSATTGEYRFLDLPRVADAASADGNSVASLSPDGRAVGYWSTGRIAAPDGGKDRAVNAVSIYNTVTGRVVRHRFTAPLGLSPQLLAWSGPDTLMLRFGRVTERSPSSSSGTVGAVWRWDRGRPAPTVIGGRGLSNLYAVGPTPGGGFASAQVPMRGGPYLATWDADIRPTGRHLVRGVGGGGSLTTAAVSADGRHGVVAAQTSRGTLRVYAGRLGARAHSPVSVSRVPLPYGLRPYEVLGWADDSHLRLAVSWRRFSGLVDVDVDSGRVNRVGHVAVNGSPTFASDLVAEPTAPRGLPASVANPHVVAGGTALVVLLSGFGLRAWGRRRGRL